MITMKEKTKAHDKKYWIEQGRRMIDDRERRIARAKKWKFDTVATHGLYDLEQALTLNNGSIMEPVYLSPAQAYRDSAEMEAGLAYEMPNWCYTRIANPSNYFLEEAAAFWRRMGRRSLLPVWRPLAACPPYAQPPTRSSCTTLPTRIRISYRARVSMAARSSSFGYAVIRSKASTSVG